MSTFPSHSSPGSADTATIRDAIMIETPSVPGPPKKKQRRKGNKRPLVIPTKLPPDNHCHFWANGCKELEHGQCTFRNDDDSAYKLWETLMMHIIGNDVKFHDQQPDHPLNPPVPNPLAMLKREARQLVAVRELVESVEDPKHLVDKPFYFPNFWNASFDQMPSLLSTVMRKHAGEGYGTFIAQMSPESRHHPRDTVRCLDMLPNNRAHTKFTKAYPYKFPDWLSGYVLPEQVTWNATPRGNFSDIHIDEGLSVVSWPVGGMKIWLMWTPPTESDETSKAKLRQRDFHKGLVEAQMAYSADSVPLFKICAESSWLLRGGKAKIYIACTDGSEGNARALYIPPGWKHVVYTLESGYLGGATFIPKGYPHEALKSASDTLSVLSTIQSTGASAQLGDEPLHKCWVYQQARSSSNFAIAAFVKMHSAPNEVVKLASGLRECLVPFCKVDKGFRKQKEQLNRHLEKLKAKTEEPVASSSTVETVPVTKRKAVENPVDNVDQGQSSSRKKRCTR
jgi:hypothetical protein